MMKRSTRMLFASLGLLSLAGIGLVVALMSANGSERSPEVLASLDTPAQTATVAARIDSQLSDHFWVFRQSKGAADALPDAAVRSLDQAQATVGANSDLSRKIVSNGSHTLYATAANGSVCTTLVDQTGAGSGCVSDGLALEGKAVGTTLLVDGVIVHGIVPDGVTAVDIALADSSVVHAPVANNGYAIKVVGDPTTLSYTDAGRGTTLDIPYAPPDAPVVAAK